MSVLEISTALVIREPRKSELPLCRMLLPEACASPIGRYFRLAFAGKPEKLVAALSYRDDGTAMGGVRVHVIPAHRRAGIGSRLLDYVVEEARRFERTRIYSDADLHRETAAEPFLTSHGFRKLGSITFAEIDIEDLRANMEASRERFDASVNHLPMGARMVKLSEAPLKEITAAYAEHITHMRALAGLRDILPLERATESIALLINEKLAGFVLACIDSGVLHIPAWVVAPEFRGRHIGVALLKKLAERVRGRVVRMRFEFTDAAVATPKMLTVPGCRITKIAARFERALPVLRGSGQP